MTIYQPGQRFETLTNQQLTSLLWDTGEAQSIRFIEPVILRLQDFKRALRILDCDFTQGLILRDNRILHDVTFNGSRFAGDCVFDFFTTKILSLIDVDMCEATLAFERVTVAPNDNADVWLHLKSGTTLPNVVTNDAVIKEMFRQLPHSQSFISYQEVQSELE